jgi:type 1 glutamine amidotransferase
MLIEQEMTNFSPNCETKMWDAMFGGSWKAGPGTHTITFYADSKEDIHESNEQNNIKSITVIVPSVEMTKDPKEKQP